MFIPIPIIIPLFQYRKNNEQRTFNRHDAELDAYVCQKNWERSQWNDMDYSKTYFYVWNGAVRECYCRKGRLQSRDVCCFVNEGKLSTIYSHLLCKTHEEAENMLRKSKEPHVELMLEQWRGSYRLVNKSTGKVVRYINDSIR